MDRQEPQPYRRHRYAVAAFFSVDESFIWPEALNSDEVAAASESEIVSVYPHRWAVPRDSWRHLFERAEHEIGILVYSGLFMAEDAGLKALLTGKAQSGVRVRILLGNPDSPYVAERGVAEGIDDVMPTKVRSAIIAYRSLAKIENIEVRLHDTILYNSIFRADDQLLVNTHIYGTMANNSPVFHLRKIAGGDMVNTYAGKLRARVGPRTTIRGSLTVARRIDYYDDPAGPKPNSMVPSVNVVVTSENDEILLIRRSDNDNWAIPGGAIDLGESMTQAAIRETKEESGIDCEITGLVGIYTDPKHVILYTSNGEARQEFSIVLTGRPVGGEPTPSSESSEVRWVPASDIDSYAMDRSMRIRIGHYLERQESPVLT